MKSSVFFLLLNKYEWVLSYLVFFLCMLPVFQNRDFIGMDIPAHQHNVMLLKDMLAKADSPLHEFYWFNPVPVPNLMAHGVLVVFATLFSASVTIKIFVFCYGLFMFYTFRLLLSGIREGSEKWSWAILPLIWNTFLEYGFFGFILAIPFAFLFLYFLIRYFQNPKPKQLFLLCFLLGLLWFSHIAVFFVVALLTVCLTFYFESAKLNSSYKLFLLQCGKIALVFLPFVFLSLNYFSVFTAYNYSYLEKAELIRMMSIGSPMIAWGELELLYAKGAVIVFLTLLLIGLGYSVFNKREKGINLLFGSGIVLLMIALYFFLPDSDGRGGYMSLRLLLLVYITMAIFASVLSTHIQVFKVISSFLLAFLAVMSGIKKQQVCHDLQPYVNQMDEAGKSLEPYATVYPIDCRDSWVLGHFATYIGMRKPIVIYPNYECQVGYFPLVWRNKAIIELNSNISTGKQNVVEAFEYFNIKLPQYILFFGENVDHVNQRVEESNWLSPHYIFQKKDGFYQLFKRRKTL